MILQAQKVMELQDPALYLDRDYAKSYGSGKGNFWSDLCGKLVEEAELKPEDIVADLGCGTGYATREIVNSGVARVYAIDPSRVMLDEANGNLDGSEIIEGTIDDLIASGLQKPTIIFSSGVFVVMQDSLGTLKKIYDYLEDNGKYIFTVEDWSSANVNGEPLDSFFERVREYKQRLEIENDGLFVHGGTRYAPEEVEKMVTGTGGKVTQSYSREMSHPAEKEFAYDHRLSFVNFDIERLEEEVRKEGDDSLRFHRRLPVRKMLKIWEELDKLTERKRLLEEFKNLYACKKWVVGTQHIFHTAKS